ncbi:SAM-dependent methyltransferase [Saccharopolyspora shandongensis]|uniref:SAM-dependent methyltransferase n=1 Tax=Saccharopolyspora shandongensis TaxID=418495 RepID=UPI003423909D
MAHESVEIDTSVPHSARMWNYWLGGKDNYAVDRAAGDDFRALFPGIDFAARAGRAFLARAVRHLVVEAGVRQFLDIGTGLPTADNTHEIAQRHAPECRIVYVDNDPLVLAHARALLTGTREGVTDYIHADIRDPETILAGAADTLDLDRPVALVLFGILGLVPDEDDPWSLVRRLMEALPPGSYLALFDSPDTDPALLAARRKQAAAGAIPYHSRRPEQIAAYFHGLELLEPGLVPCTRWRPDEPPVDSPADLSTLGGIGRKP